MICPRCSTTMIRDAQGRPYCYPCSEGGDRGTEPQPAEARPPVRSGGPLSSLAPPAEAFRLLQERVAKLESAVEDLRRRTAPRKAARPHFLGEIAEEPSPEAPGERR